jgi:hypothetical protein
METYHTELENKPEKRKSLWIVRFFLRTLLFILIMIVLLVGVGGIIGYYYQDEVKEYVVGELNKQLNTEIIVDGKDIDFTVIKNFPYASIDFKNVKALEALERKNKDTLFSVGKISLQFNIVDVFKKNYHIKKIEIDNAYLKIKIDKDGNDNYHFWKTSADTDTTHFSLALENIVYRDVHFFYKDRKAKQSVDVLIKKSNLSGNFSDERYSLETVSDLFVNTIKTDSTVYLRKKNVHAAFALDVDSKQSSYKIKEGKLKIENLLFLVFGSVINVNNESIVNIGIKGNDMDIKSVLSLIPATYKSEINDYNSNGEFYFDATVQGSFSENQTPRVIADFGIRNADITQIKDNVVLKHVNLKGHYFSGDKNKFSSLTLQPFSAELNEGNIAGELSLQNLDNPSFIGKIKANLRLGELQQFLKIDTIETIAGKLAIDVDFSGEEKDISSGEYKNIKTEGVLLITEMNVKLKNNSLTYNNINGDFKFDNNDLLVNNFTGNIGESDFDLKGSFRNTIGYFLKDNQEITIEATLNSKAINLNELLETEEEDVNSNSNYKLRFSENINVNLNSEIEHLFFRKFDATNIRGVIKLSNKKLSADPIVLSTMDGIITSSCFVDGSDSTKLLITCVSDINKINITKMFEQFENFGQAAITDKNLKGKATAKIQFASIVSPDLQIDLNKLYAGIDMTIESGELNNVESMKSLSRFIELKDLENIRFSTLKNQIEIKNQVITIPKMEIKSNAINVTASGTHTFDNEINYKIKLSLNELLAKKAIRAKKENDEFGEIADDGLGRRDLFLSMTGTVDKPIIKYDSKGAVEKVRQDLKVEKQTLKTILKDEFGLFKKDSTLTKNKAPKDDTKFIIKWDEADKKEEKKELKKPKKQEEDDF